MAELYSYTEGPEFQLAQSAFEETAKNSKEMPKTWNTMTTEQRCSMIQTLLDRTEVASRYSVSHNFIAPSKELCSKMALEKIGL